MNVELALKYNLKDLAPSGQKWLMLGLIFALVIQTLYFTNKYGYKIKNKDAFCLGVAYFGAIAMSVIGIWGGGFI